MNYRSFLSVVFVICHFLGTHGIYIPPTSSNSQNCRENDNAIADALEKLEHFYSLSGFNSTMVVPQTNLLRVDHQEYDNIRAYCKTSGSKFQTVLDFKFLGEHVRFSTSHLSTCPWVVVDEYDEDRLPKVLAQAKCLCSRCLQKTNKLGQYIPRLGRCKPVMTSVMTIRRKCDVESDVYAYTAQSEQIAVGCTCTSPIPV